MKPITMKTIQLHKTTAILITFLGLAALSLPSCEKLDPVEKEPRKIELNKKSAEVLQADRQFAFELFKEIHALSDADNLMISPLSTS